MDEDREILLAKVNAAVTVLVGSSSIPQALFNYGCIGRKGNPWNCPVSIWVKKHIGPGYMVAVDPLEIGAYPDGPAIKYDYKSFTLGTQVIKVYTCLVNVRVPEKLSRVILDIDQGMYPNLVEVGDE